MVKTHVTLTIDKIDDENAPGASSQTMIQTDSIEELQRMLSLAGVQSTPTVEIEPEVVDIEIEPEIGPEEIGVELDEEPYTKYKPEVQYRQRMPKQKVNNPRFSDNSMMEAIGLDVDPKEITDMYFSFLSMLDGEEAVARTADYFGMRGEDVVEIVKSVVQDEAFVEEDEVACEDCGEEHLEVKRVSLRDYMDREVDEAQEITMTASGEVMGQFMDGLDHRSSKAYLDSYPMGVVLNPAFEEGSFIFKNRKGQYRFYNKNTDRVEDWDWRKDVRELVDSYEDIRDKKKFLNDFWYEPADEYFPQVNGGMDFYDQVLDEAYGQSWEAKRGGYEGTVALLPIERLKVSLDELGDNEYFGKDLTSGQSSVVCFAIDTGTGKPRLTFASTYGGASNYRPGQKYMTYHDQTGKERPAVVLDSFSGKEYMDPKGREAIKRRMAAAGMDPRKRYSVRVFK